ncbi:hypothetical protein CUN63_02965 [Pseudomonas sp. ACM7]|nr:hypothetical protein CUN63_02965 [Pseudomonas sp. ACM7]
MGAAVRRSDLLAKALGQSTSVLNAQPLSRASRIAAPPLPHGFCVPSGAPLSCPFPRQVSPLGYK